MHPHKWVRGRTKGAAGLSKGRDEWLELGMSQMGEKHPPEVGILETAEVTQPMIDYVQNLISLGRQHTNMPDVAFGLVDSVKSALTMHYMMWPATNVSRMTRLFTGQALKRLMYTSLVMALSKRDITESLQGVSSIGIEANEQMIEAVLLGHRTDWPDMLPQDRPEMIQEMVQRRSAGLISIETAVRRLDGQDGVEEELKRIEEDAVKAQEKQMEMAEQQSTLKAKEMMGGKPGEGKKPAPKDQTNKAQAKGGRSNKD